MELREKGVRVRRGEVGGLNTYAYVEGNPVSYIDPYGLATQTDVTTAYQILKNSFPNDFSNSLPNVDFSTIDGQGKTNWDGSITMNSDLFGGNNIPLKDFQEDLFLQTLAHEMLHKNQNPAALIRDKFCRMNSTCGYWHRQLDERAEKMANKVWKDYRNRKNKDMCTAK